MLLINPDVHVDTQPAVFKPFTYASFPTAIGYLAGYLQKNCGAEVSLYDEQLAHISKDRLKEMLKAISGPKIVGISVLTGTAKRAYEITRWIKEIDDNVVVVLGGIHPTALPEEPFQLTPVDLVVRGEGEATLGEIYDRVAGGYTDFDGLDGVSFRAKDEIVHNGARKLLDVNEIPTFPYELFAPHLDRYPDFGTIISSRGCPFSCSFCSQRIISGNKMRYLSKERVLNKIKLLADTYGQRKIFFADDVFTVNMKRTIELCDEIIESGYHKKVSFVCESRAREICMDEERGNRLLSKMKEANFVSIAYGVETGSESVMQSINKSETVEDNIRAIEMTYANGISADASLIMGLPGETREDRKLSVEVAKRIPLDAARFNVACPYPGTKFYEDAKVEGRLNIGEEWVNCSNQHYLSNDDLPYTPKGTTAEELVLAVFLANMRFTLRPKTLLHMLFADSMAGGTVVSVHSGWWRKPAMLAAVLKLAAFLARRSVTICYRGLRSRISGTRQGADAIPES
jgi:radical SAM superfamily enzyme YgiQ (UPF0313 family)